MAELFPDEGLDYLLGRVPGGSAAPGTLYLGLFTSQTSSTVPAGNSVLATATGVTEAAGTDYARVAIAAAAWGAAAAGGGGRQRTAAEQTLPTVGTGGWGTINGFFIATALTGGIAVFYANFDDLTPIVTAPNDIIKITPLMRYLG